VTSVRKIGSYEVASEIGQGGMGVVHLGRQPSLDRPVVLKKLRRDLVEHPRLIERFEREARSAASVHHQSVVAIYDTFVFRSDRYIVAEYVDGDDLKTILSRSGRIAPRVAALIGLEVMRGLEEIHARGIVHRDLKPANVLIGKRGETKITDFGIALGGDPDGLTRPGVLLGSPPYISPEQMLGERAEYRSDLFSFGVMLYELVTGSLPFPQTEAEEGEDTLLQRVQRESYPPVRKQNPAVPRRLARLIRFCMRARAKSRPPSATSVRRALERQLGNPSPADCREEIAHWFWKRGVFQAEEGQTVKIPKPPLASRRQRRIALRRGLAAAAALVLLHGLWLLVTPRAPRAAAAPPEPPPRLSLDLGAAQRDTLFFGALGDANPQ
jgi:serine/threonine-protein kinase